MMYYFIDNEITKFSTFPKRLRSAGYIVDEVIKHAIVVKPKTSAPLGSKDVALGIMGITHGNEVVGSAVINGILELIEQGAVRLDCPVAFIFGNPAAAKQQKRFLQSDLNRSFSRLSHETDEEKRAAELQPLLNKLNFLLDIHQTTLKAQQPFFIFPFSPKSFVWARHILPQVPIVTHWGNSFSRDGKCSDEYVNSQGGIGLTLELGRAGFSSYQIGVGIWAAIAAIKSVTNIVNQGKMGLPQDIEKSDIYTFAEVYAYPQGKESVSMNPGWYNFKKVSAGETLGMVNNEPITAKVDGRILFPSYVANVPGKQIKPAELFRLIKKISLRDLPESLIF